MKYIAVFYLKNKDLRHTEIFDVSTDDLAKDVVQRVIDRLESDRRTIVTGTELCAIDNFVPIVLARDGARRLKIRD